MANVPATDLSADEALQRLIEGNERFMRGEGRSPFLGRRALTDLLEGQQPFATILGCSDSRVPPEIIFDADFGDLFIVRVAGNIMSPEIMGTLQYAGTYLHTPLFVVLGHEHCGAVRAALETKFHGTEKRERVQSLLQMILPGLAGVGPGLLPEGALRRAVDANVRWSMDQVLETPEAQARVAEGRYRLVGAVYELATGRVRFLED
ncbi:MAG: Carbonic anhydrase 2 [Gammaproteobacteria bacterium]|nr:Carbonic anhydrase 2 [Gammaproteobacteria bacterium]